MIAKQAIAGFKYTLVIEKKAISLKHQILADQAIRERLENEIIQSQKITTQSSTPMEITFQSFLTKKLKLIHEGENE